MDEIAVCPRTSAKTGMERIWYRTLREAGRLHQLPDNSFNLIWILFKNPNNSNAYKEILRDIWCLSAVFEMILSYFEPELIFLSLPGKWYHGTSIVIPIRSPKCGTHYFFMDNFALTMQIRGIHLSNAHIKRPNHGAYALLFLVGATYFFSLLVQHMPVRGRHLSGSRWLCFIQKG